MPYKRRSNFGSRPNPAKKRRFNKSKKAAAPTRTFAKKVKAVMLKNAEPKRLDGMWSNNQYQVAQVPVFTNPLFAMDQGDKVNQREGDVINLRGIALRMIIKGDVLSDTNCRVSLIYKTDDQAPGEIITYQDIYSGDYSNFFLDRVRDDKTVSVVWSRDIRIASANQKLDANSALLADPVSKHYKWYIPLKSRRFEFQRGGVIGKKGTYYLVFMADRTSSATSAVSSMQVSSTFSVYYRDL